MTKPIEKEAQMLSNLLVQLVEIKPGKRVLDIATGIGGIYIKEIKI